MLKYGTNRPVLLRNLLSLNVDALEGQDPVNTVRKDLLNGIVEKFDWSWWHDDQIAVTQPDFVRGIGAFAQMTGTEV